MDIPTSNKILIIFVSWKNPLFSTLLKSKERTPAGIAFLLGVAANTVKNWQKGNSIDPGSPDIVFNKARNLIEERARADKVALMEILDTFAKNYNSTNRPHIYKFAEILNMPIDICQNILDEAIYDRLPLFPELFFDASENERAATQRAEETFQSLRGLFDVWIERDSLWLFSQLRVRYLIKIRSGIAVRCKLNVPKIAHDTQAESSYFEYDGFVAKLGRRMFWIFEQRPPQRSDYMYFITDTGAISDHHLTLAGTYMTLGQEEYRPIVTGDVFLQRSEADNIEKMEHAMHNNAKIILDKSELPASYRRYNK